MIGTADLNKAIATLWNSSSLDSLFTEYWRGVRDTDDFLVLNDAEAAPGSPLPYVVFTVSSPSVQTRMSGVARGKFHIRDTSLTFDIYAEQASNPNSAKEIAAELAEEVMKVFGGHPTVEPQEMELDNGHVLNVQYQQDYGERQGDTAYHWIIEYTIKVDVPVKV